MANWETIIGKLEVGKALEKDEIAYVKAVFQTANTHLKLSMSFAAKYGPIDPEGAAPTG